MPPVRVLIVEDERLLAEELTDRLTRFGLDPIGVADTHDAAVAMALRGEPDLVLMDVRLKGSGDGIEAATAIRAARPDIDIVFLTAHSDDKSLERAQQAAPIAYLYKPFDERQLRAALALAQGRRRHTDEAMRDPLTGCWNRRGLADVFVREADRCRRARAPLGVVIVDLDAFKPINDTYGHSAGDRVLVEVAHRITASVRPYDSVVRYGGDEFVVVLPDADEEAVADIGERIRRAIAGEMVDVSTACLSVSASVGTAVAYVVDVLDGGALVDAADASLYAAKREGRNRVGAAVTAPMAPH